LFFVQLLCTARSGAHRQASFMNEALSNVESYLARGQHELPCNVPLPLIKDDSLCLLINDFRSSQQPVGTADSPEWRVLEAQLCQQSCRDRGAPWLGLPTAPLPRTVVVNEEVYLYIRVENPLEVELSLSSMQLDARLFTRDGASTMALPPASLECPAQDFVLAPLANQWLRLTLRPLEVGELEIGGCHWVLQELMPARYRFVQAEGTQRSSQLSVQVVPALPLLRPISAAPPETLVNGELRHEYIELTNTGAAPLVQLRALSSHPAFVWLGCEEDSSLSPVSNGDATRLLECSASAARPGDAVALLPDIEVGETLRVQLIYIARSPGKHRLRILFYYQGAHPVQHKMEYRLLQYTRDIEVRPALAISHRLQEDGTALQDHQLLLQVDNRLPEGTVSLEQVAAVASSWRLAALHEGEGLDGMAGLCRIPEARSSVIPLTVRWTPPSAVGEGGDLVSSVGLGAPRMDAGSTALQHFLRHSLQAQCVEAAAAAGSPSQPLSSMEGRAARAGTEEKRGSRSTVLHLFVAWALLRSGGGIVRGIHIAPGIVLQHPAEVALRDPLHSLRSIKGRDHFQRPPLKVVVDAPQRIEHDFSLQPTCLVPITLRFANSCETKGLDVTFRAWDIDEGLPGSCGPYAWLGCTRKHLQENLPPGAEVCFSLHIVLWEAGLYCLDRCEAIVKAGHGGAIVIRPEMALLDCCTKNAIRSKIV